jgi:hypothetical protein
VTPMRHQRRVAVTSPQTRVALAGRRTGAPFVPPHLAPADAERARRIHHRQLQYALTVLAMLAALLLGLPLVLAGAPALDAVRFVGIPISWLAVAVLPFPLLALLAGWQLRKAERAERSSGEGRRVGR